MHNCDYRDTRLTHLGRDAAVSNGFVNVPVCRGSTILADTLEQWTERKEPDNPYASYGRFTNPTLQTLAQAVAELEGGHRAWLFPSGLAACSHALLGVLEQGDHVLLPDSVYGPMRAFALQVLAGRMGIQVQFYEPSIGAGIAALIRSDTKAVYVESPGSGTFEIQDIPAIACCAHAAGAYVIMDNTWATPLFFRPFEHGVDISVHAATKYLTGHSDALLGVATANERAWPLLRRAAHDFGQTAGPDDAFLALRGLRTLGVRLRQHQASALQLARFLERQPQVLQVLHPALESHPGHALWERDFLGSTGLFGVVLEPLSAEQLSRFFRSLKLFGIGLSWGGFESLALPLDMPRRDGRPLFGQGQLLRLHVGLEDVQDLQDDLQAALAQAYGVGELCRA
ncbi:cystathionine beta-lyase [Alcaligenes sp. Marseille-Q7550]